MKAAPSSARTDRPAPRKKGKKAPQRHTYEYVLLIAPRVSQRTKRAVTLVALRTVKEFSNFKYELVVDTRLEDRTLHIDIRGLRPPQLTLPDVGPATFETELDDLRGALDVVVRRPHKETNVFRVNISPEKVAVEEDAGRMQSKARFVDLVTREEDW